MLPQLFSCLHRREAVCLGVLGEHKKDITFLCSSAANPFDHVIYTQFLAHVYNDESDSSFNASLGVVVPSHNVTLKIKLAHVTSFTASELAAIF